MVLGVSSAAKRLGKATGKGVGMVAWWKQAFFVVLGVAALAVFSQAGSAVAGDYSFKVHNKSDVGITKVLVREAGGSWGSFDIGTMIEPGRTAKLVWAKHTNNQDCEQWIKVVYADGSEAKATKFDFCEDNLEIEFE
ncbi:hypothetical protein DMR_06570 [Solidesulfovibrio magneticus RS-1]|uniref:Uncharacterized protein n=2 Tax=Solidesulfovibrio TaxID=2910984 RepID=C4XIY4_SOLM1|nr:hypothetical protein DMR_06570 [Solidesulfovibrio magneticus RS-1]